MFRVALLAALSAAVASAEHARSGAMANPIRKVVTLLQKMQAKVEAESEKEKDLFEKFMCYCKTGAGDLQASIEAAEAKAPQLEAEIKAAIEKKAQTDDTVAQAKKDRADAKDAMSAATAQREKEAAAFQQYKDDATANIGAMTKAIAALEKGAGMAFLQTPNAATLRKLVAAKEQDLEEADRDELNSFLQGNPFSQGYAAQSGEIIGILKQMNDEMQSGLEEATKAEEKAISVYEELMEAKKTEVDALTKQIETKIELSGELAVSIAEMKNDVGDTLEMLEQDKKFLAELKKSCSTKEAEWEERCKIRQQELAALADTIKMLNSDDALELFKKTLPAPSSASFLEVSVSAAQVRRRALAVLRRTASKGSHHTMVSFIIAALHGKKISFEKIIAMIDEMVATLKQEQVDDDSKKEYCNKELDAADDKKKILEKQISDAEAAIEVAKEGIATATEEIEALTAGIKKLDKSVAEATEQRKEEDAAFKELMASDTAAKELLKMAQNRLNKFYNPKLYKPPAKKELSSQGAIERDMSFVQVRSHSSSNEQAAPPPPPETFGAYTKKTEESGGVMQMINLLIADLDKEMTEAETEEKNAQSDYETLMKESAEKRAEDSKAMAEREKAKADMEGDLQANTDTLENGKKDLMGTEEYIHGLHLECDWLIKYYDVRKEMRSNEIDALGKAKAVLSGADYSLLQSGSKTRLLRH